MTNKNEQIEGYSQDEYLKQIRATFLFARFYKDRYDALVSVGFTEHDALEIIKARGIAV